MDRILFIVPPYIAYESFVNPDFNERTVIKKSGSYGSVVTDMPIGLLSLSAYLKKFSAAKVDLIDFNTILAKMDYFDYDSFSEFFHNIFSQEEFRSYDPTVVGISALFTTTYYNMIDIAEVAKKIFPSAMIIAGGGVPTNMYNDIFRDSQDIKALCYGEGEKPLLGLLTSDDKESFLRHHNSWITKEKLGNGNAFQHEFIENLDEIPLYDYELLDVKAYGTSPTVSSFASFEDKNYIFHFATSRGCPHHCCYCSSHTVHGRKMRYHSVERVREDMLSLKEKYDFSKIGFQDDHFMASRERAVKIINISKELNLNVFFQSGLALYTLDRKMLKTMHDVGVRQLVLALESGSNRVLKEIMHKPVNLSIAKRVINDCRELGMDTDVNILIGLPGETKSDIQDSLKFLKTLGATWYRIYIATPLVGSEMFDICIKGNYITGNHIGSDFKRAVIETEDFDAKYIKEKAYSMNLELNFICNSDYRLKNYEKALQGFENTISVKFDHAFAYYFAAKCNKEMNNMDKYGAYKKTYENIIKRSEFWADYADKFDLMPLE